MVYSKYKKRYPLCAGLFAGGSANSEGSELAIQHSQEGKQGDISRNRRTCKVATGRKQCKSKSSRFGYQWKRECGCPGVFVYSCRVLNSIAGLPMKSFLPASAAHKT